MYWQQHANFDNEFKKLTKSLSSLKASFEASKKLLELQFDAECPKQVITPAKLHRLYECEQWSLWKLEMIVKGVRPNLCPRV